jgi:hypothetical protein
MAYVYYISLEGSKVGTKILECDVMREGNRTYIRVPGLHGWGVRKEDEVFDDYDECRAALIAQLGGIEASAAHALSRHHNENA